jgi:hypothetical protein
VFLTAGALIVAARSASAIPWIDDWDLVKPLTGADPVREWLGRTYINHLVPLPRVLLLSIYTVAHGDFRVGPVINVTVLGTTALFLIVAARRWRGHVAYSDALFPIVLLAIDHEILFATLGVNLIPSTVFSCILLMVLLRFAARPGLFTIIGVYLLGMALGLSGSSGIAQVPAVAIWLAYNGVALWRENDSTKRKESVIAISLALALVAYVGLYFMGLEPDPETPPFPGMRLAIRTTFEFLSMVFGPAAWTIIPGKAPKFPVFGILVAAASGLTACRLVWVWTKRPAERLRSAGLLLFLVGMGALSVGLGVGRSVNGPGAGFASRYSVYAAPILFAIYLVWELYGPAGLRRLMPMCVFFIMLVFSAFNIRHCLVDIAYHVRQARVVEADLMAGLPPELIAERHVRFLLVEDIPKFREQLVTCMRLLRDRGMGVFGHLQDRNFAVVTVPLTPAHVHQAEWKDGIATCTGDDPSLTFVLPKTLEVMAIRIHLRYENARFPVQFQAFWKNGAEPFSDAGRTSVITLDETMNNRSLLLLVNGLVDVIRIDPDGKPCTVRIEKVELLVPVS